MVRLSDSTAVACILNQELDRLDIDVRRKATALLHVCRSLLHWNPAAPDNSDLDRAAGAAARQSNTMYSACRCDVLYSEPNVVTSDCLQTTAGWKQSSRSLLPRRNPERPRGE